MWINISKFSVTVIKKIYHSLLQGLSLHLMSWAQECLKLYNNLSKYCAYKSLESVWV